MMRRPGSGSVALRRRLLLGALLLGSGAVAWRAATLQWIEAEEWARRAEAQHSQEEVIPAPRGTIYDRNGIPLVVDREVYRVAVAPREVRDASALAAELQDALGIPAAAAKRAVDPGRRWVLLPGRYDASVRERLSSWTGVYFQVEFERTYPRGELAIEVLGRVGADGKALSGLELELDSILRGRDGLRAVRRDGRGEPIPGSEVVLEPPRRGSDVYLTIDAGLQEIVEQSLSEAIARTGAEGGDLLIVEPRTGEILAAVTRASGANRHWRAVTDPYEPGSTMKPFSVAALLAGGHATTSDSVYAERGRYQVGSRTITDVQAFEWLTLRDALRVSSNVAMAKFAERMAPAEHYAYLRDAGFGTPTGVPYPSEASGLLRRPSEWSRYSQQSLAMGYEISATPLQVVLAYAALANGGTLMEPRLVREVHDPDGRVVRRFEPRAVRRVFPEPVAREVASVLADAVETGSGREASLGPGTPKVAGKTGTARRFDGRRYERRYTASFAGFFPADAPQLAFLVKLDEPEGDYYGGLTAAPVTRHMLTAALAAQRSPLDRGAMAAAAGSGGGAPGAGGPGPTVVALPVGLGSDTVSAWPAALPAVTPAGSAVSGTNGSMGDADSAGAREVPRVAGLPLRDAVRALHARGFAVVVEGAGVAVGTEPASGATLPAGSTVIVRAREEGP